LTDDSAITKQKTRETSPVSVTESEVFLITSFNFEPAKETVVYKCFIECNPNHPGKDAIPRGSHEREESVTS